MNKNGKESYPTAQVRQLSELFTQVPQTYEHWSQFPVVEFSKYPSLHPQFAAEALRLSLFEV